VTNKRWTPKFKTAVLLAIEAGELKFEEALARYEISGEEFASWQRDYRRDGTPGLRVSDKRAPERRHLPAGRPRYWTAQRKTAVLLAVEAGELTLEEALAHYEISRKEFASWQRVYRAWGTPGLRVLDKRAARDRAIGPDARAMPAVVRADRVARVTSNQFAVKLIPVINSIRATGVTTPSGIAAALTARGVPTARGGRWQAQQVRRILARR
jgi:Protein of unknown function (DUF1153)